MPLFGSPNVKKLEANRDVPGLIKTLGDQKSDVRDAAAEALGRIGAPAVEPLIAAFKDWDLRDAAAEALGRIGAPAVEPLIAALQDGDQDVREYAAGALGQGRDARSVDPLMAALKDQGILVRVAAAEALVRVGAPAVSPLIAAFHDENGEVRAAAAEALVHIGAPAVGPLIAALQDGNVRMVSDALVHIGAPAVGPLIAALQDGNVRAPAVGTLAHLGSPAVGPLVEALRDQNGDVRVAAADALDGLGWRPGSPAAGATYWAARGDWDECVQLGAAAVEPVMAVLRNIDPVVGRVATEALVKIGAAAVEPLMAILKDGGRGVLERIAAAEMLGRMGAPAVEPLVAALEDRDQGVLVRTYAAEALVRIGGPAVEPLVAAFGAGDQDTRKDAARTLGRIGDARAVEPLVAALRDRGQGVLERTYVTEALVAIGAPGVGPLMAAFGAGDRDTRKDAARTLGRIGDARAVEPLVAALRDRDQAIRRSATDALVKIGTPAVDSLIAAFKDPDVRKYAARALGRIGDPRALPPLSVGLKDERGAVRLAAAEGLVHIGAPAVEPLMAALRDGATGVRRNAAEALAMIGEPALEPLIAAFGDGDQDVRKYAAGALGRIGDPRARRVLRGARSDPDQAVRKIVREGLAGQALADKLRRVRVGMTEKTLTELFGRPAGTAAGATASGGSSTIVAAVPGQPPVPESWVFETEFGSFQVVVRQGRVAERPAGGLLGRLRPAWRTRGT